MMTYNKIDITCNKITNHALKNKHEIDRNSDKCGELICIDYTENCSGSLIFLNNRKRSYYTHTYFVIVDIVHINLREFCKILLNN